MPVPGFPAVSGTKMLGLLTKHLGYQAEKRRGKGKHLILRSTGRPQLTWSFGKRDLSPVEVRKVLLKDVGLTLEEALEVIKHV